MKVFFTAALIGAIIAALIGVLPVFLIFALGALFITLWVYGEETQNAAQYEQERKPQEDI